MKQGTDTINIYNAQTLWDFFPLDEVYDSLLVQNPMDPSQLMNWMTKGFAVVSPVQLGYTPPAGTVETLRFTLRVDIFCHHGVKLTANDVTFTKLRNKNVHAH